VEKRPVSRRPKSIQCVTLSRVQKAHRPVICVKNADVLQSDGNPDEMCQCVQKTQAMNVYEKNLPPFTVEFRPQNIYALDQNCTTSIVDKSAKLIVDGTKLTTAIVDKCEQKICHHLPRISDLIGQTWLSWRCLLTWPKEDPCPSSNKEDSAHHPTRRTLPIPRQPPEALQPPHKTLTTIPPSVLPFRNLLWFTPRHVMCILRRKYTQDLCLYSPFMCCLG
jgi:hypothetical protein